MSRLDSRDKVTNVEIGTEYPYRRCSTRRQCKQKERGLIRLRRAHEIRSARGSSGKQGSRARDKVERARYPEAIGLGRRNAPVGCPRGPASSQLATEIRSGRRSSGCLGTDDALVRGRGAVQRKVTRRKSHAFKDRSAGLVAPLVKARLLSVKDPQGASRQTTLLHKADCAATEGRPSESCRRRTSNSLLLSKTAPRPTW